MATMKTPKNKANNVKDLTITKVDFVDAGANQRANITLFKRNPTKGGEKMSNPVKKFISTMAKHLGISERETAAGIQAIAKDSGDAQTFNTMVGAMMQRKIFSQVWDITDALGSSLRSILDDDEVTDKAALMKQSVDEFSAICKSCIDQWAAGNVAMLSPQKAEASDLEKSLAVERAEAPQVKQAVADRIARQRQQHDSAAHTRMRRFQQADEQKRERREHGRQRQRGRKRHRRQKRPGNGNRRRHAAPLLQHGEEQRHAHAECEKGKRVKQVEPFDNASFFESYHVPSLHRPHVPIARCAAHAHCPPSNARRKYTVLVAYLRM